MKKWNEDPFTKKARREDYEARSIYKLEEIDKRENIFRGVQWVLDLGAAPGSWTQYCLKKIPKNGKIIAVDLNPLNFTHPSVVCLQSPIHSLELTTHLGTQKVDLVLSDMAPQTSGVHERDVALSLELANLALSTAEKHLKIGGTFIVKVFMGDSFEDFHQLLKGRFQTVRLLRPQSTRKASKEIYFICKDFKVK